MVLPDAMASSYLGAVLGHRGPGDHGAAQHGRISAVARRLPRRVRLALRAGVAGFRGRRPEPVAPGVFPDRFGLGMPDGTKHLVRLPRVRDVVSEPGSTGQAG